MSQLDEMLNAKMYAEKAYYANLGGAKSAQPISNMPDQCGVYDPSLRAEAEQRVSLHRAEAEKHDQAAAFFRENPAFDQFVRLIRSGAIQI